MRHWFVCILFILCVQAGAQAPASLVSDSLRSPAAERPVSEAQRSDSLDAAFKMEALQKVLLERNDPPALEASRYQPPHLGKLALRMALGLGVVLILIYVLFRMARKARGMEVRPGEAPLRNLQVLETVFVGSNQKVVMLRVGAQKVMVVGATPERVSPLCEIQGEEALALMASHQRQVITPAQFSETVNHLLRRFRKDGAP